MFNMKDAFNRLKTTWSNSESSQEPMERRSTYPLASSSKMKADNKAYVHDDDSLPPVTLLGYAPKTKNRLLNPEMCDELRPLMPTRIQLYQEWTLLYSLEQHGASLHSLYERVKPDSSVPRRVGYVLVIKDRKNSIFGAYSNEAFHPNEHMRYSGNGECFLWKMDNVQERVLKPSNSEDLIDIEPNLIDLDDDKNENKINDEKQLKTEESQNSKMSWKLCAYPYTGANEFMIYCTSKFLSMGAGDGHYGLWCDDSLMRGVTNPTQTYGNDILSKEGKKFSILGLEVWRVG